MIDTYYKADGKEYAKQYGTEVEVNHEDRIAKIDGIIYTLRHARAPKPKGSEEPTETAPKPAKKKKTYKRKK